MNRKNIFVTGISGCVGHYLFDALANDPKYHIYFLVRHPEKLKFDYKAFPNVSLINDDLCNIKNYTKLLRETDYLIHLATGWGGSWAFEANYEYTLRLFELLDRQRCKKIIYFSTASILGENGKPLEEAGTYGTPYIKSKYQCYKELPKLRIYDRILTLFPTLVFGGDERHPYSHASLALLKILKWINLIRFFRFDLTFHFIHARDIASISKWLLENDIKKPNLILGNKNITLDQFIEEICRYLGNRIFFRIPISPTFPKVLAKVSGKKLSPWALFCLDHRNWRYEVVNASAFGLKSSCQTVEGILEELLH